MLGITGTGGSGKSSLTDELVRRFRVDQEDKLRIAVLAVDPTRRRGGGALLGDRIRMNALDGGPRLLPLAGHPRRGGELPEHLADVIAALQGRRLRPGDRRDARASARATPRSCRSSTCSLYVMTPEFGAASQLEKIDMLDFADVVAINKFERRGAEDALRDVARQLVRNREAFGALVGGHAGLRHQRRRASTTTASPRSTSTCAACSPSDGLRRRRRARCRRSPGKRRRRRCHAWSRRSGSRYLAEIAETVRGYHADDRAAGRRGAPRRQQLRTARGARSARSAAADVARPLRAGRAALDRRGRRRCSTRWPRVVEDYSGDELVFTSAAASCARR